MLMRKIVNNDVSKDSPIRYVYILLKTNWFDKSLSFHPAPAPARNAFVTQIAVPIPPHGPHHYVGLLVLRYLDESLQMPNHPCSLP